MDPVHGPLHGPGPWTTLWTTPYFLKLLAEKSSDEREKRYTQLSGQFKLEPMTTTYVTAFNIYIDYDLYRLPFRFHKKQALKLCIALDITSNNLLLKKKKKDKIARANIFACFAG